VVFKISSISSISSINQSVNRICFDCFQHFRPELAESVEKGSSFKKDLGKNYWLVGGQWAVGSGAAGQVSEEREKRETHTTQEATTTKFKFLE
jgi:hypothetical protein